jgi:hypothetical protein
MSKTTIVVARRTALTLLPAIAWMGSATAQGQSEMMC